MPGSSTDMSRILLAVLIAAAGCSAVSGTLTPRAAALRSAVMPGWGQHSLGRHGRGNIFLGIDSAFDFQDTKTPLSISLRNFYALFYRRNRDSNRGLYPVAIASKDAIQGKTGNQS